MQLSQPGQSHCPALQFGSKFRSRILIKGKRKLSLFLGHAGFCEVGYAKTSLRLCRSPHHHPDLGHHFHRDQVGLAAVPPLYIGVAIFLVPWACCCSAADNCRPLPGGADREHSHRLFSCLGYIAQTAGMVHSAAAKAGFITGLAVVLVPVLGRYFSGAARTSPVYICRWLLPAWAFQP